MGWWGEQAVPRLVDVGLGTRLVRPLRARVCEGLAGELLEIGFGSALNLEHYPPEVGVVQAVEPSDVAWRLARRKHLERGAAAGRPTVRRAGLDGQRLDLPDTSVDSALSTFSLCTIPDAAAALAEVRRVLRPGGAFHFLEHGLAPDPAVVRWQRRLAPVQYHLFGGCHLDRPIAELVGESGLVVVELDRFYYSIGPRSVGSLYLGRALREG
jgi:ubiquinone/menaquinone biosynthesis C-methylase UbiE